MEYEEVRLDRWLWAARFFKTRALAQQAIAGGHVHVNGQRSKAARPVHPGDRVEITRGDERMEVEVRALSVRRGPAPQAQKLYAETASSVATREAARQLRRDLAGSRPPATRPDKRARRRIISFTKTHES